MTPGNITDLLLVMLVLGLVGLSMAYILIARWIKAKYKK